MNHIQTTMDKTAIGFSIACILHCILTPIALILFPAMLASSPLAGEGFHKLMLLAVIPTSVIALGIGCRKHGNLNVIYLCTLGLTILLAAGLFGEILGENGEVVGTIIGAIVLAVGHFRNHNLSPRLTTLQV